MDESGSQFLTHFKRRTGESRSDHATDRIVKCILLLCPPQEVRLESGRGSSQYGSPNSRAQVDNVLPPHEINRSQMGVPAREQRVEGFQLVVIWIVVTRAIIESYEEAGVPGDRR